MTAAVLVWGAWVLPKPPRNTFTIAVLTDMVNQDPRLRANPAFDGTRPNPPALSQVIFDLDAALTRQVAAQHPAFVVWPENEFADADDARFIGQLERLAAEVHAYIVADTVWHTPTGMYDAALMVSPQGQEVGRRAKINITPGERAAGFAPGPKTYPVFATPYGRVGLAVCWDRHRPNIVRELARHGAQIVLMPVDDDFDGNPRFPPFHASDGVFRAAENHVAVGLGTTNGLSLVVDPFGRITAQGPINARSVNLGTAFVTTGQTLYTRWGDWFGWTLVLLLIGLSALAAKQPRMGSVASHSLEEDSP